MEPSLRPTPPLARSWIALESLLATAVTLYLAIRLDRPSVWILVPLALLILRGRRADSYGLELRLTPPPLVRQALFGLAALLLYGAAHFLLARIQFGSSLSLRLPEDALAVLVYQFVVVAFPEEFFFRGYLQSNLNRIFPPQTGVLGATVGPALVLQAALFALCHLATGDWTRLSVFFFGLLAGWLRERNGSIFGPILYHGVANFWHAVLASSLR